MTGKGTLALVESATQLLNAAEWTHAGGEQHDTRIVALSPADRQSVRQLTGVAALVRASGIEVEVRHVRVRHPAAISRMATTVAELARCQRLVIGDPFSRYIQTLLPAAGAEHVVIVDDGTATWDFAVRIDAGEPLIRWTRPASSARRCAFRAAELLSPGERRSVDVFSCLAQATAPVGATPLANRYRWLRSLWQPLVTGEHVDLLGTSLVDTGVVNRAAYLKAIRARAQAGPPIRYIAHRRESENLVAAIATIPNVTVVRPELPVEFLLRQGPTARRVTAFPSTAAHTLPLVLAGTGARVDVQAIQPLWFTQTSTVRAREFVDRIATDAPATSAA